VDLYPWIVFLHVVGVLLFFIAHGTSMAVGFRLKRERDPARVRALLELTDRKSLLALRALARSVSRKRAFPSPQSDKKWARKSTVE
jgi:hypothetical protein